MNQSDLQFSTFPQHRILALILHDSNTSLCVCALSAYLPYCCILHILHVMRIHHACSWKNKSYGGVSASFPSLLGSQCQSKAVDIPQPTSVAYIFDLLQNAPWKSANSLYIVSIAQVAAGPVLRTPAWHTGLGADSWSSYTMGGWLHSHSSNQAVTQGKNIIRNM